MIELIPGKAFNSRASAYRSAALNIPDIAYTELVLDAEDFDTRGEFNTATGRFTAEQAGYYVVTFSGGLQDLGDGKKIIAQLRKNGGVPALATGRTIVGGADWIAQGANKIVYLAAGDYVSVFLYHNHGAARAAIANPDATFLAIHRLS